MNPIQFYKCLADDTRLRTLLLITYEEELCVCELTTALELSQPKISRHLALLRSSDLLQDRRQGQWVFYRINPDLSAWARSILLDTLKANQHFIAENLSNLIQMGDRPQRTSLCC
ncbi:metalloregulator ArsR/SmtB family transcription factor [Microbulbifer sp. OS29]|uniref:Metalloregulator ArsR/SmtB family transcription factor n=1 Tax=Microbulbifer okhotskensis TaxID=2926617 RepID=A0A9X2J4X0_9GAMM|nr:metalloregulator ArsR/SmtB family transcription factor [Microbulbifer okhotskensis]MCO1334977.1 metalloregulator ArsR/SmtB family transcription factor [Microbulbifer okhotskensis]